MRVRTLVRSFPYTFGFVALLSVLAALAGARPACAQLGFDRPGGDYASAPVEMLLQNKFSLETIRRNSVGKRA